MYFSTLKILFSWSYSRYTGHGSTGTNGSHQVHSIYMSQDNKYPLGYYLLKEIKAKSMNVIVQANQLELV